MAKQNAPTEVSEYEKQRQANILERDKLLKQLALDAASAGLAPKPPARVPTNHGSSTPTQKRKQRSRSKEEVVPLRHSARLAGIKADNETFKRKAEEEFEARQEAERLKRQRVSGDLNLSDIVVAGSVWNSSDNVLADVTKRGGARPYERTFTDEDIKNTTDKDLRALREKFSMLELYDGFEPNKIKITPERIYTMGFHPTLDKPLVFAGDKLGNLGVFDASQKPHVSIKKEEEEMELKTETRSRSRSTIIKQEPVDEDDQETIAEDLNVKPSITTFHLHARTISSLQFDPSNSSSLYTGSYDSSIRLLDLSASKSIEIYAPSSPSLDEPISCIALHALNPHVLHFSRLDGAFGIHDLRTSPASARVFYLSDKKIGGFSLHPSQPHILATASLDRHLRLWDLRKARGASSAFDLMPHSIGKHESRLSVSHAAFSPRGDLATSSYDDTVKIYDFSSIGTGASPLPNMEPKVTIKHNNQTGRWVTILRPHWQANPQSHTRIARFAIGNMNRFVDVYASSGAQLAQLGSPQLTAVPAVAVVHDRRDWIAGGTASGKLALWM